METIFNIVREDYSDHGNKTIIKAFKEAGKAHGFVKEMEDEDDFNYDYQIVSVTLED